MPCESVSLSGARWEVWGWKWVPLSSRRARLAGWFVWLGVGGGVVSGAGDDRELPEKSSAGTYWVREGWPNNGAGGSMLSRAPRGETTGCGGTSSLLSESESFGFVIMRGPSLRFPVMVAVGGIGQVVDDNDDDGLPDGVDVPGQATLFPRYVTSHGNIGTTLC